MLCVVVSEDVALQLPGGSEGGGTSDAGTATSLTQESGAKTAENLRDCDGKVLVIDNSYSRSNTKTACLFFCKVLML